MIDSSEVLPEPDGPVRTTRLAGLDRQGDAVNGDDRPRVDATDVLNDDARPTGMAGINP